MRRSGQEYPGQRGQPVQRTPAHTPRPFPWLLPTMPATDPKGPQVDYKESTHTLTDYLQIKQIMCLGHLRKTIVKARETLLWFVKDTFVHWLDS